MHRTEIQTANVFSLQVAFVLLLGEFIVCKLCHSLRNELLYLSIEEHGDNLNPVFKDILYAAFYKRKEMYYFFYAS